MADELYQDSNGAQWILITGKAGTVATPDDGAARIYDPAPPEDGFGPADRATVVRSVEVFAAKRAAERAKKQQPPTSLVVKPGSNLAIVIAIGVLLYLVVSDE